mgnify:CR=1 FL=1
MSIPTNLKSSISSDFLVYTLNSLEKSSIFDEDLFELLEQRMLVEGDSL